MKYFSILILSVVFTCIGLGGGWFASAQKSAGGGHEGHGPEGDAHAGHDHGPPRPAISPQARQNLGVTVAEANPRDFYRYKAIPAIVVEAFTTSQPLFAPAGGTVMQVEAQPGAVVTPGTTVVRILRDPLPRPVLTMTGDLIKPAGEQFHSAIADLRRALRGTEILKTELERIRKFTETGTQDGLQILPKKNEIDLRYDLARADQELENSREKLRLHGLSNDQVKEIELGTFNLMLNEGVWQRALKRNGLWTEKSENLHAALHSSTEAAWTIAAIGELTGAGLVSPELIAWLKEDQRASSRFLEIAALLQQGTSIAQIKVLYAMNALEPVIDLKVPALKGIQDWDVHQISVKPFEKVEAGRKLLTLANPRQMWLRSEPVGSESPVILNALKQALPIEAVPLVDGSGPVLKELKIQNLTTDEETKTAVALISVHNEPLSTSESERGKFRTWQLREGQKYMLRVPTHKYEKVFVFPNDAITDDGPDKVVFIEDGDSFKAVKVAILYQDHEYAVIDGKSSEIFPGDGVVQHGAFGLGIALRTRQGEAADDDDPHAGHNHPH